MKKLDLVQMEDLQAGECDMVGVHLSTYGLMISIVSGGTLAAVGLAVSAAGFGWSWYQCLKDAKNW